jgi:CO/xanthine dehydrogenase FAD-binding subunit
MEISGSGSRGGARSAAVALGTGPAAYLKFCHRLFDWALVGAAAQRTSQGWRIGLVNVAETPVRAAAAEQALNAGAPHDQAAMLASDGLRPTQPTAPRPSTSCTSPAF